ncbi:MAG: DUF4199 domain-containing protein [Flavobacterium sp.]|uniref:DUF4199 domain-containing protein n=1 Tax=Flavobacterium sp. TaxID=239 RepID=UPI000C59D195|nr:DUF4199 domain-containing protein [Flavobacterium sp.]MBF01687.1 DUF4199 domain-containing protein [Flavobacterium sp.]|tara:strand:- start:1208 stop:1738 length:531 start_codon:yes stop_codon:yes gene_type:complete
MNEIMKKNGIKFGIISGIIGILSMIIPYVLDLSLLVKWWYGLSILLIYFIIGCILLINTRKELNDILSFKDAFKTYFISALIGIFIGVLFNIIFFNYVDTEVAQQVKELNIENTVAMMKKFGAPTSSIKETVEKLEDYNQFGVVEQLKGIIWSLIGSTIFGLILAAIFKRKPKEQI